MQKASFTARCPLTALMKQAVCIGVRKRRNRPFSLRRREGVAGFHFQEDVIAPPAAEFAILKQ